MEDRLEDLSNELTSAQFVCWEGLQKGPESGVVILPSGIALFTVLLRVAIFLVFYCNHGFSLMVDDLPL